MLEPPWEQQRSPFKKAASPHRGLRQKPSWPLLPDSGPKTTEASINTSEQILAAMSLFLPTAQDQALQPEIPGLQKVVDILLGLERTSRSNLIVSGT